MGTGRGRTGYLIFANERRLEVLNQLKEQKRGSQKFAIAEVSKELGRLWNELTEEQREEYKTQAASSKSESVELKGEETTKNTQLSQSTVKKIMTEDDEVKRISAEGLKAMTIVTELFIKSLAEKCSEHSKANKRSNIRVGDLESVFSEDHRLDTSAIIDKIHHSTAASKGTKRLQEDEIEEEEEECTKRQKTDDNSECST